MKYIKELDSIRGIGIIIVVLFHWLPVDSFYNTFPNRPFGVDVFFVLSGFLITQILLVSRLGAEAVGMPLRVILSNFYFRRALRILPLYFLVVFLIIGSHEWLGARLDKDLLPVLTFTLNFHFFASQYWGDLTTHLWTLSIEEQFYLAWPWIILLVRKRYLLHVVVIFICTGIISQLMIDNQEFGYLPTNTCFDAFGIGALLAWIHTFRADLLAKTTEVAGVLCIVSAVVLIVGAAFPDVLFLSPQRTLRSIVAAWAIAYILNHDAQGTLRKVPLFGNPILMFLGKISYGMYLFHLFFPWMYEILNKPINNLLPSEFAPYMLLITVIQNGALLVLISWLSYHFFERPLMNLSKVRGLADRLPGGRAVNVKTVEPALKE